MHRVREDGVMSPLTPGSVHRRQSLELLWLHDGGVVVVSRAALDSARNHRDDPHAFFGSDRRGVTCESGANLEIDTPADFRLVEAMLGLRTPANAGAGVRMAS